MIGLSFLELRGLKAASCIWTVVRSQDSKFALNGANEYVPLNLRNGPSFRVLTITFLSPFATCPRARTPATSLEPVSDGLNQRLTKVRK